MILREKINLSLLCLLPLIAKEKEVYLDYIDGDLYKNRNSGSFINGYYSDINRPWLNSHVFLMYETVSQTPLKIMTLLESNENFINQSSYRIANAFYNVYTFSISIEHKRDYDLMIKGEYSKISYENKIKILLFWNLTVNSILFKGLFPQYDKETLDKFNEESIGEKDYIPTFMEDDPILYI